jgi:hypothetical protein
MRFSSAFFERPACDACGGSTVLKRLAPDPTSPDGELRTFECSACGHTQVIAARRGDQPS